MTSPNMEMSHDLWADCEATLGNQPQVRILEGALRGMVGRPLESAGGGRVLIELQRGVMVELDAACLETVM